MKFLLLTGVMVLAACGQTRLALHPSDCAAPTAAEAQLTKSVWQNKQQPF